MSVFIKNDGHCWARRDEDVSLPPEAAQYKDVQGPVMLTNATGFIFWRSERDPQPAREKRDPHRAIRQDHPWRK